MLHLVLGDDRHSHKEDEVFLGSFVTVCFSQAFPVLHPLVKSLVAHASARLELTQFFAVHVVVAADILVSPFVQVSLVSDYLNLTFGDLFQKTFLFEDGVVILARREGAIDPHHLLFKDVDADLIPKGTAASSKERRKGKSKD